MDPEGAHVEKRLAENDGRGGGKVGRVEFGEWPFCGAVVGNGEG